MAKKITTLKEAARSFEKFLNRCEYEIAKQLLEEIGLKEGEASFSDDHWGEDYWFAHHPAGTEYYTYFNAYDGDGEKEAVMMYSQIYRDSDDKLLKTLGWRVLEVSD